MSTLQKKRAFITGIGGQDGYYLSRWLLDRSYEVVGCGRAGTLLDVRGDELRAMGAKIVDLDLLDRRATFRAIADIEPAEIHNLAGHSFVPASWDDPTAAIRITSWPAIHLLEAIRAHARSARFYQSSSSELFGSSPVSPQDEYTPVAPANPYAAAKVFAHQIVALYRQHHGLFAVSGILYNHESPRRPPPFVTRKVVQAAVRIKAGEQTDLVLGDLDVARDWGFAGDFVDAMWRMLQIDEPSDFVIGTGKDAFSVGLSLSRVGRELGKLRLGWSNGRTSFDDDEEKDLDRLVVKLSSAVARLVEPGAAVGASTDSAGNVVPLRR